MIQPDEIQAKAERLYPAFLNSWLANEEFFPRAVPCNKGLDDNLASAALSIQRLRDASKEVRGFGYSVEWEERTSRRHGKNRFPRKIVFESASDFLRLLNKQRAFSAFAAAVEKIRCRRPELEQWIRRHRDTLVSNDDVVDDLLDVVDYFAANPRPNVFARELPLSIGTKFIERNEGVLRAWLDIVLPPAAIVADEEHFARRFGLNYAAPLFYVRFLDPAIQRQLLVPWIDCAVPLHSLAETEIPASHVLVVENKTNLLTLPELPNAIGIWGMGYGALDLRYLAWLRNSSVWYWGDLDADGFCILSRLRVFLPHVRSLLMNNECLTTWLEAIGEQGIERRRESLPNLIESERLAYERCIFEKVRIEQEYFPQSFVIDSIRSLFSRDECFDSTV